MLDEFDPFDDFALVPVDGLETLPDAGKTVTLELLMDNLGDGAN
jgi:iron transport multicopper oxidase